MRFFSLLGLFLLPCVNAYADSTCARVSDAFLALGKTPHFTISQVSDNAIITQGRPDGIYEPQENESGKSSLGKSQERDTFSKESHANAQTMMSEKYRCDVLAEETINGTATTVYTILEKADSRDKKDRAWIGKDDGLFHQISERGSVYTLTYQTQE